MNIKKGILNLKKTRNNRNKNKIIRNNRNKKLKKKNQKTFYIQENYKAIKIVKKIMNEKKKIILKEAINQMKFKSLINNKNKVKFKLSKMKILFTAK